MITETQQGRKTKLELYEMLEEISKAQSYEQRVELVRSFSEKYISFKDYIRCVFDSRIQFLLPNHPPPYTPAEENAVPSTWHKLNNQLKYFVKGLNADNMHPLKRETMFISILESVHPSDAEILVQMILKKTSCEGLTVDVVKEACPNLIITS